MSFTAPSNTTPLVGVGLRHTHYQAALQEPDIAPDFIELHAENFFASGGLARQILQDIQACYPISIHGTSLGLGSHIPLPNEILAQFSELVASTSPILVSEHLCFNRAMLNGQLVHSGDLLPIRFDEASLQVLVGQIQRVQDAIKRPLLLENLSAYIELDDETNDSMSEAQFLSELCVRCGCGLLLDINNLLVNALNQRVNEPLTEVRRIIDDIPLNLIGQLHLAGFTQHAGQSIIIDDHGSKVSEECWMLYKYILDKGVRVPCLIEWDSNLPTWDGLMQEYQIAKSLTLDTLTNS